VTTNGVDIFFIWLICGSIVVVALSIVSARVFSSIHFIGDAFGLSSERKKIRDLELRLAKKDELIKKAIASYRKEGGGDLDQN